MIKVGFYLDNDRMANIDCSKIDNGNPGLGGTQYMFWYISSKIVLNYQDLHVTLFANHVELMPPFLNCISITSDEDVIIKSKENNIDILVIRGPYISDLFYKRIQETKIKVITWCHNYERYPQINQISKCPNILRNICVGKEQLDRLVDHPLYKKSEFIYNTIQFDLYDNEDKSGFIDYSICFLGSIIPEKGFHALAKVWPEIERRVPEAQLYVIGSGDFYNKKKEMGPYGIAYKEYEESFIRYLIREDKTIKPNVHFMGAMGGTTKIDYLKKMYLAVPKSTLTRETFNICAIEFEACGVPVVAGKAYSLVEVVSDQETGMLFSNDSQFVDYIVELLKNKEKRNELSCNCAEFVKRKFSEEAVLDKWHRTIIDVYEGKTVDHSAITENLDNNRKRIRLLNKKAQNLMPFLPSIAWWEDLPHIIKSKMIKK